MRYILLGDTQLVVLAHVLYFTNTLIQFLGKLLVRVDHHTLGKE